MKKIFFSIAATFTFLVTAWAQTPEEILAKMDKAMEAAETAGLSMVMDLKIPILGTTTATMYMLGDKVRTETSLLGHKLITFSDGVTEWEYESKSNELTIKKAPADDSSPEAEMFEGITDGYDVTLKNETADAWYLVCKKSKDNIDKDDPSKMDLVVSKKTYLPISLSTKMQGVRLTLRDVVVGVDEKLLDFRVEDYPDAKIIDQR
jgi:outer membrane lipoprotein-sorting protein